MTNNTKAALVLTVMVLLASGVLAGLWYLATEKTDFTDTIDPQPNATQGN